jgi:hypothetical protein
MVSFLCKHGLGDRLGSGSKGSEPQSREIHAESVWEQLPCITIIILGAIHGPVFHLIYNVSETGFCLRLQVHHTQLDTIDRASLRLRRQDSG